MYAFDLVVDLSRVAFDDIQYECEQLLSCLHANNQVINEDFQIILDGRQLRMPVISPEANSLDPLYSHQSVADFIASLEKKTQKPLEIRPTGRAADSLDYEVPVSSSSYILYGKKFAPILCGDTYKPIPLYRLPPLHPAYNSYRELNFWHWTYQGLDKLWLMSHYGEVYALRQMQQVDSPFSRQGRDLCRQIEELTGVPTYYFLENRRGWSEQQDRKQRCPLTGKEWLIEGSTFNDFIGFKSEEARLVSQLSSLIRHRKSPGNKVAKAGR